ncbi:conserved Plasmodium protein, unknown function [Plasmodium relictum]|uniref:S1 motif domain-containing protein n=1 Tax=Plasmodium relictum TaxID=85471 RepID=A0A1J1HHI2_PLARL|nr:conserved Plasmodium protein, unknown function [Plasmodium relictum]CRH03740.1 conserved Plasmodium protein, unknown function [Plasmodium relictum]
MRYLIFIIFFISSLKCKLIRKYYYINRIPNYKNVTRNLRRNKKIYNTNDLFEFFTTLYDKQEEKYKEEKKKKNHSVTYIQKLPKKNILLKRWKYDLFEKIKEKMKKDEELKRKAKLCKYKYKLPIDFYKLGDELKGKIVHVEDQLIKLDINSIHFAHLYIKRYFSDKSQIKKKYEIGKYIDVVICYIHKKNKIIQVTDNEEEIKVLKNNLKKLHASGYLKEIVKEETNDKIKEEIKEENEYEAKDENSCEIKNYYELKNKYEEDYKIKDKYELENTCEDEDEDKDEDENNYEDGNKSEDNYEYKIDEKNELEKTCKDNYILKNVYESKNKQEYIKNKKVNETKYEDELENKSKAVKGTTNLDKSFKNNINVEKIKNDLGLNFGINQDTEDLMYIKEEKTDGELKKITDYKIEDEVNGVVKFINEEGAYLDIGCKTLAFLNLGHYNKDPNYIFKNSKKKRIEINDYFKNLKIRKIDVLNNRIEVSPYSMQEEACLRILNQQETLQEQNKYIPCSSFITYNYHMINYIKKYNELKKKKKNIYNLFEKNKQLDEMKNIKNLKESEFTPFILKYNELSSPNSNYQEMFEHNADNEKFFEEIGATSEKGDNNIDYKFFKEKNKKLKEEIENYRKKSVIEEEDEQSEKATKKNKSQHNINNLFKGNNFDFDMLSEKFTKFEENMDHENDNYHFQDLYNSTNNVNSNSLEEENKYTLSYLKKNLSQIKKSVINEHSNEIGNDNGKKKNKIYREIEKNLEMLKNDEIENNYYKNNKIKHNFDEDKNCKLKNLYANESELDESYENEDEDEDEYDNEDEDEDEDDYEDDETKDIFDLKKNNVKENFYKNDKKKNNIFKNEEMKDNFSEINENNMDEDCEIDENKEDENDSFLNVRKNLKYILSKNINLNLIDDDEKCIEEASKLFGEDIKTWEEKMYYYFGSKDSITLDNLEIYDDEEFKNSLSNENIDKFNEFDKILNSENFDLSNQHDFLGAKYTDAKMNEINYNEEKSNENITNNIECKKENGDDTNIENYINTFINDEKNTSEKSEYVEVSKKVTDCNKKKKKDKLDILNKNTNKNLVDENNILNGNLYNTEKVIEKKYMEDSNENNKKIFNKKEERIRNEEHPNSSDNSRINVDKILKKAISIGNIIQKKNLEKLLKKRNNANDNSNDLNSEKNINFLKMNKITKKNENKNITEPKEDKKYLENYEEQYFEKKNNKSEDDDLKAYKYASYEVQGYYKRKKKKKMINLDDLEEIKSEKDENILLNDEDFINKHCNDYKKKNEEGTNNLEDEDNFINLNDKKDIFLLYGNHDKIIENNFIEKILENEKESNKSISKEIDFLIESYKHANIYPNKLINNFLKKQTNSTVVNNKITNVKKVQCGNDNMNKINDMFNEENINELGFYLKSKENHNSINIKDNINYELNSMLNQSFLLKELSLKLGLIKKSDMHLNDKELISLFLKNVKFKRALKFYGVSTKNISIPVIYKITKLLYFERPFPRKEKNHKLNIN